MLEILSNFYVAITRGFYLIVQKPPVILAIALKITKKY